MSLNDRKALLNEAHPNRARKVRLPSLKSSVLVYLKTSSVLVYLTATSLFHKESWNTFTNTSIFSLKRVYIAGFPLNYFKIWFYEILINTLDNSCNWTVNFYYWGFYFIVKFIFFSDALSTIRSILFNFSALHSMHRTVVLCCCSGGALLNCLSEVLCQPLDLLTN